ncbi:MAG: hypothetical protein IPP14_11650 [Planctomycetes bacterium]|nr:hypothetical protein [Planctomycetota bacterium]
MKTVNQGLFGRDGLRLPGAPGTFSRVKATEEELAEATACPLSADGKCCSTACPGFRADGAEYDANGHPTALRFYCEGKPPARLCIGVVRGLRQVVQQ